MPDNKLEAHVFGINQCLSLNVTDGFLPSFGLLSSVGHDQNSYLQVVKIAIHECLVIKSLYLLKLLKCFHRTVIHVSSALYEHDLMLKFLIFLLIFKTL